MVDKKKLYSHDQVFALFGNEAYYLIPTVNIKLVTLCLAEIGGLKSWTG